MNKGPGAINRIYRLVWRDSIGAFVAVAETSRGRGKRSSGVVGTLAALGLAGIASVAAAGPPAAGALPTGGVVTAGQASISQNGSRLDIQQGSARAAIDWQTFNIGAQAQVNFYQPNASSVALNRVLSADPSAIYGHLSANGQVILVNPNGIVFGPGSRVDVGGIVASTLSISNADFMGGRLKFTRGDATGSVVNQGTINAADGGYIALLAPEVRNEGVLSARLGSVAMAAGDAVTLDLSGDGLLSVKVDPASVNALVENRNLVQAEGGRVLLSAGAANRLIEQAVAGGEQGANELVAENGSLRLVSTSGTISAAGGSVKLEGSTVDGAGKLDVGGTKAGSIG
ncbi:MAG: filamentous hemagglutinin N-terminal domain-containing protein, partial [Zoogloea sp.]|nr:filamentous hemagglutinin N-terminal domain-containing protein [Zoogloea sp.]